MANSTPLNDARPDIVDCGSIATHCPPPPGREEREVRVVGGDGNPIIRRRQGRGMLPLPVGPSPRGDIHWKAVARVARSRTTGISVLKVACNDCRNMRGFAEPEDAKTEGLPRQGLKHRKREWQQTGCSESKHMCHQPPPGKTPQTSPKKVTLPPAPPDPSAPGRCSRPAGRRSCRRRACLYGRSPG